jgi:outer membrane protein OmpA-like peptidoglycan-associated protein
VAPGQSLRVAFETGSAHIGPETATVLKQVAKGMAGDDKLRIQLLAYAAGSDNTARQARRLSLSRALAARSFLIGEGVRSTRIDVRALGNKSEGGPPDRIDIVVNRR